MNRKQAKKQVQELKQRLRTANRASDYRLLKLVLIMIILATVAAVLCGKIPI